MHFMQAERKGNKQGGEIRTTNQVRIKTHLDEKK